METTADDISSCEKALGALLIERGKLDPRAFERAMRVRGGDEEGVTQLLSKLGLVSERDIAEALAEQLSLPLVTARDYPTLPLLEGKVTSPYLMSSALALQPRTMRAPIHHLHRAESLGSS